MNTIMYFVPAAVELGEEPGWLLVEDSDIGPVTDGTIYSAEETADFYTGMTP